jgi:hypothetical protein
VLKDWGPILLLRVKVSDYKLRQEMLTWAEMLYIVGRNLMFRHFL